jgi:hypothetical protein
MNRTDNAISEIRNEVDEIRREREYFHSCMKDHHGRLCILENNKVKQNE